MQTSNQSPQQPASMRLGLIIMAVLMASLLFASLNYFDGNKERPFIPSTTTAEKLDLEHITGQWQQLIKRHHREDFITTNLVGSEEEKSASPLILIHLWNPGCLCNAVSQRHVNEVLNEFDQSQVKLWVVTPESTSQRQMDQFKSLNPRVEKIIRLTKELNMPLTSSPGLAIANTDGQLNYYGAYGFGMDCTPSGENFFANMINNIQAGAVGPFLNIAGNGCFCPWP